MSKKTSRTLFSVVVIGAAFVVMLFTTMQSDAAYFKHVDEIMPVADQWQDRTLQLHGFVVENSIRRRDGTLDYRFDVKHGDSVVTANYTGIVPDTFKDGAEVVLKGSLVGSSFQVEKDGVTAKCPSKYEASGAPAGYQPAKSAGY